MPLRPKTRQWETYPGSDRGTREHRRTRCHQSSGGRQLSAWQLLSCTKCEVIHTSTDLSHLPRGCRELKLSHICHLTNHQGQLPWISRHLITCYPAVSSSCVQTRDLPWDWKVLCCFGVCQASLKCCLPLFDAPLLLFISKNTFKIAVHAIFFINWNFLLFACWVEWLFQNTLSACPSPHCSLRTIILEAAFSGMAVFGGTSEWE